MKKNFFIFFILAFVFACQPSMVKELEENNVEAAEGRYNTVGAFGIKAHANNRYVCADSGGASSLIANKTSVGHWETFDFIDLGGGRVALKAHANGRYVCAENGGASALIANRTAIGLWETFQYHDLGGGKFALKALANNRYVCAENGGSSALIANRTAIGLWETFQLVHLATPAKNNAVIQTGSSTVPTEIRAGETKNVRIRAYNNGTTTWTKNTLYRLGATSSNRVTWSAGQCSGYYISPTNSRIYLCSTTGSGRYQDFNFRITAPPNASGSIRLSVRMVRDGVEWFGSTGNWTIKIIPDNPPVDRIDMAAYIGRTDGGPGPNYTFSSGELMRIQSSSNVFGKKGFYQVKNANWEEFAFDANWLYRFRDTSEGANRWYCLYANSTSGPGAPWLPRYMKVNGYHRVSVYVRHFYDNCTLRLEGGSRPEVIRLEQHYPSYNLGGRNYSAIRMKGYSDTTFRKAYEEWIYAEGVGLVQWTLFADDGVTPVVVNKFTGWTSSTVPGKALNCNP